MLGYAAYSETPLSTQGGINANVVVALGGV